MKKIKVFVAGHCVPCHELIKLIERNQVIVDDGDEAIIKIVDIESEEGFKEIDKRNLTKVPTAMLGNQECSLSIDNELNTVIVSCVKEDSPNQPDSYRDKPAPVA